MNDQRHVSFTTRRLGKKVHDDGWKTTVPHQNTPSAADSHVVTNEASSSQLSEISPWGSGTSASGGAHQSQQVDAQLNATAWAPGDIFENGRQKSHRHGLNAPQQETQPESDSSECVSSDISSSESDLCQVTLKSVVVFLHSSRPGFAALERCFLY